MDSGEIVSVNIPKENFQKRDTTVEKAPEAAIWKIDRFAIHDGPGIRTNVYFKGCPLRCLWCSNPEGQHKGNELGFLNAKCTGCGLCWDSCPQSAIKPQNGIPVVDRAKCNHCGQCSLVCPTGALCIYGRFFTLSQIMDIIERDRHIYRRSGGGITCTGGEPLLQARFLQHLLAKCHKIGIHTTLETSGCVPKSEFQKSLTNLDWLFFDLKHIYSRQHKKFTGKDNALILGNLRLASSLLGQRGKVLVIRQVIVPGFNDASNIRALSELARQLPHVNMIELLPYHNYGMHKYRSLGREYLLEEMVPPSDNKLKEYKEIIERSGIDCKIGGL